MDRAELLTAPRLGASGYVLKKTEPDALLAYMRNCHKGAIVLDSTLVALLADEGESVTPPAHDSDPLDTGNLTEREGQTLA